MSANFITNNSDGLYQQAQETILRVDHWFSWMLGIAGVFATLITILLVIIAWKYFEQSDRANKLLDELEKRAKKLDEKSIQLSQIAKLKVKQKKQLSKAEVAKRAKQHRGFESNLFQATGESPVYAVDENNHRHWIPNPATLIRMGYSWSDVKHVSKQELDLMDTGENIPDLSK